MIRRLFVCCSALLMPLLWICPQVWAQSPNLTRSLIRVAHPGALAMPGMPGMAASGPFTYNSDISMSFDPNAGSQGTLYVNWQFTGTTTLASMCQNPIAQHKPVVAAHLIKSGTAKSYHSSAGYFIRPCDQMNQTLTIAFDLGFDSCNLGWLMDGTCGLEEQEDEIFCTQAGLFAALIKGIEVEGATTVSQVVGIYPPWLLAEYCAPSSEPPDWKGPAGADSFGSGYWVTTELVERTFFLGKSYGVPWKPVFPVGPAGQWAPGPKPICQMWDHGCSFVTQTCTAKAIPTPNPYQPDAILKRRDA